MMGRTRYVLCPCWLAVLAPCCAATRLLEVDLPVAGFGFGDPARDLARLQETRDVDDDDFEDELLPGEGSDEATDGDVLPAGPQGGHSGPDSDESARSKPVAAAGRTHQHDHNMRALSALRNMAALCVPGDGGGGVCTNGGGGPNTDERPDAQGKHAGEQADNAGDSAVSGCETDDSTTGQDGKGPAAPIESLLRMLERMSHVRAAAAAADTQGGGGGGVQGGAGSAGTAQAEGQGDGNNGATAAETAAGGAGFSMLRQQLFGERESAEGPSEHDVAEEGGGEDEGAGEVGGGGGAPSMGFAALLENLSSELSENVAQDEVSEEGQDPDGEERGIERDQGDENSELGSRSRSCERDVRVASNEGGDGEEKSDASESDDDGASEDDGAFARGARRPIPEPNIADLPFGSLHEAEPRPRPFNGENARTAIMRLARTSLARRQAAEAAATTAAAGSAEVDDPEDDELEAGLPMVNPAVTHSGASSATTTSRRGTGAAIPIPWQGQSDEESLADAIRRQRALQLQRLQASEEQSRTPDRRSSSRDQRSPYPSRADSWTEGEREFVRSRSSRSPPRRSGSFHMSSATFSSSWHSSHDGAAQGRGSRRGGMVSPARDSRPASPLRNVSPIRRRPKDQNSTCKLRKFRRARIEVAECVGKVSLSFFFFFFFFFFSFFLLLCFFFFSH